jgi:hypothetical protein
MMCTRTIATGAGITGNADCPPAFLQSGNPVPLGLWCCAVSSPVAAPGLTRTYMLTAYTRRLHSMSHSSSYTHSLVPRPICSGLVRPLFVRPWLARALRAWPPAPACDRLLAPYQSDASAPPCRYQR